MNSVWPEKKTKSEDPNAPSPPNIPNSDLSYRCINYRIKGLGRIYHFHNAPIIKFVNHFVSV